MNRVVMVSCGKKKIDMSKVDTRSVKARDLYTSEYFKLKRRWAERYGNHWTILSAKFGPFSPTAWTRPYDVTLDDYPEAEGAEFDTLEEWADSVVEWLEHTAVYHQKHHDHDPLDEVVVLSGEKYIDPWIEKSEVIADDHGFRVVTPLQQFDGIGKQMQYLKEDIEMWDNVTDRGEGIDAR